MKRISSFTDGRTVTVPQSPRDAVIYRLSHPGTSTIISAIPCDNIRLMGSDVFIKARPQIYTASASVHNPRIDPWEVESAVSASSVASENREASWKLHPSSIFASKAHSWFVSMTCTVTQGRLDGGGYGAETWRILALRRLRARILDFQPAGWFFSRKFGRLRSSGQWPLRECGEKLYLITDQFKAVSC